MSAHTCKGLHTLLGDAGMVDFVAIRGYYALVAMILDVFRAMPPANAPRCFPALAAWRRRKSP